MLNLKYLSFHALKFHLICKFQSTNISLLKPPTFTPPPKTARSAPPTLSPAHLDAPTIDHLTLPQAPPTKLITHNERSGSKTTTFSEKVMVEKTKEPSKTKEGKPCEAGEVEKGEEPKSKEAELGKVKIQRGYSWKISRPSLRKKNEKGRSGSDSDAILVLNNGRDHSQCNGRGVTRHVSIFEMKYSFFLKTEQNN